MLRLFYESVVAGAILFAEVCWRSRLKVADVTRLNKPIHTACNIVRVELDSPATASERRMLCKLCVISDNLSHPLHGVLVKHRRTFSTRLIPLRCTRERDRKSFLPVAIKPLNSSLSVCVRHPESQD